MHAALRFSHIELVPPGRRVRRHTLFQFSQNCARLTLQLEAEQFATLQACLPPSFAHVPAGQSPPLGHIALCADAKPTATDESRMAYSPPIKRAFIASSSLQTESSTEP